MKGIRVGHRGNCNFRATRLSDEVTFEQRSEREQGMWLFDGEKEVPYRVSSRCQGPRACVNGYLFMNNIYDSIRAE